MRPLIFGCIEVRSPLGPSLVANSLCSGPGTRYDCTKIDVKIGIPVQCGRAFEAIRLTPSLTGIVDEETRLCGLSGSLSVARIPSW